MGKLQYQVKQSILDNHADTSSSQIPRPARQLSNVVVKRATPGSVFFDNVYGLDTGLPSCLVLRKTGVF